MSLQLSPITNTFNLPPYHITYKIYFVSLEFRVVWNEKAGGVYLVAHFIVKSSIPVNPKWMQPKVASAKDSRLNTIFHKTRYDFFSMFGATSKCAKRDRDWVVGAPVLVLHNARKIFCISLVVPVPQKLNFLGPINLPQAQKGLEIG